MAESLINNELYHALGDQWYQASDHPVALLRKEAEFKLQWLLEQIGDRNPENTQVLDVGCGGGFISNALAAKKFKVTGVDVSTSSLDVAERFDKTNTVRYVEGDAHRLNFDSAHFDIVMCLDVLEHVSDPDVVIREAARVLKSGGIFVFHTMNRNLISYLIALKGVEWFVKNTPPHLHVYSMFITPHEMATMCAHWKMLPTKWTGLRPKLNKAFFNMLKTGIVSEDFAFKATSFRLISYMGIAIRD